MTELNISFQSQTKFKGEKSYFTENPSSKEKKFNSEQVHTGPVSKLLLQYLLTCLYFYISYFKQNILVPKEVKVTKKQIIRVKYVKRLQGRKKSKVK